MILGALTATKSTTPNSRDQYVTNEFSGVPQERLVRLRGVEQPQLTAGWNFGEAQVPRNLSKVSKTEHTMPVSDGDTSRGMGMGVVGLECGRSVPKVAASTQRRYSGPALPVRLSGVLCSYPLKQFLPGL